MFERRMQLFRAGARAGAFAIAAALPLAAASAHHPDPDGEPDPGGHVHLEAPGDPSAPLAEHDAATADIVSSAPFAHVVKNLEIFGRGERLSANATTDVWALDGFAYTGTFNAPCGGEPEGGIWVWDIHNAGSPELVTVIPSPEGSRSNDVKVASMNSGRILVHSNEVCDGVDDGPGGFEIYNVNDPANPVHLAHVRIDEINPITPLFFAPGALEDNGVHNLFLFRQGMRDFVAAQSEGIFDGFRIYDITDPANPVLVSGWGAEEIFDPGVGDLDNPGDPAQINRALAATLWLLGLPPFDGFGASQNRLLHDFTVTADGTRAYLAHWDAGLILLDISDPANPEPVSVALDPENGSIDGEVNSHSVWPSEDGRIVVEGEEDFSVFETETPPTNLTFQNLNTIPGVAVSTVAGDALEGSQTGNAGTLTATSLTVDSGPLAGEEFDAVEMVGNNVPLGEGSVSGNLVWVGRACNGDLLENPLAAGDIAIVRRGACFFSEKEANVAAEGAAAIVIANNLREDTVWSGLRVWDYSDPANPVLAANINTVCSADPRDESCDRRGTYSSHNVIVETADDGRVKAYVSWYSDGVLIFDVTDPYLPVETARFHLAGEDFEVVNGGIQDVWGIYKEPGKPWIHASDRNGGLYVLKELGSGTSRRMARN